MKNEEMKNCFIEYHMEQLFPKYNKVFSADELDYIADTLVPFISNFGYPVFQKDDNGGYYVYVDGVCYNIVIA